jgi:hypothetical protein
MKTFRVTYVPLGREDKEWIDVEASSQQEAVKNFKFGILVSIRLKEEDND